MMKEIKHPYKEYEQTYLWELIDNAVNDLEKNQDIVLTTQKEYIIGYICKSISPELKRLTDEKTQL